MHLTAHTSSILLFPLFFNLIFFFLRVSLTPRTFHTTVTTRLEVAIHWWTVWMDNRANCWCYLSVPLHPNLSNLILWPEQVGQKLQTIIIKLYWCDYFATPIGSVPTRWAAKMWNLEDQVSVYQGHYSLVVLQYRVVMETWFVILNFHEGFLGVFNNKQYTDRERVS